MLRCIIEEPNPAIMSINKLNASINTAKTIINCGAWYFSKIGLNWRMNMLKAMAIMINKMKFVRLSRQNAQVIALIYGCMMFSPNMRHQS